MRPFYGASSLISQSCCAQQTGIGHVIVEALLTISTYVTNDLLIDDKEIRSTDRLTYSVHFSWSCLTDTLQLSSA